MRSFLTLKARKRNLYELYYKGPENRITESFIKMLEKSKPSITPTFLELLGIRECHSVFNYSLQVNHNIKESVSNAIVLGISGFTHEFDIKKALSKKDKNGNPDAHIYAKDNSIHILFEVKIGNNKLTDDQLYRHSKRFKNLNQADAKVHIINKTWNEISSQLKVILNDYAESHRNYLLIDEFLDLITPNGYKDIFFYKENEHLKNEYIALDNFIKSLPEVSVEERNDESIDYLYNDINFATIFPKNNSLILKSRKANMQAIVNDTLNFEHFNAVNVRKDRKIKDERYNFTRLKKEGIIVLYYKNDRARIEELIKIAYSVRKVKNK